jgi:hypothetical protein
VPQKQIEHELRHEKLVKMVAIVQRHVLFSEQVLFVRPYQRHFRACIVYSVLNSKARTTVLHGDGDAREHVGF